ncbi:MAG: hypothetical protein COB14_02605 [Alphaproteobacteria bacterium]|nr:MAG: hypothetical protein COB14_02605 [Alphaproteobacteria bacterium]
MRLINLKNLVFMSVLALGVISVGGLSYAAQNQIFSNSGLKIPRFVSLAKNKTNVRAGPGQKYPVKWVINRKSLPVEVILEFDHWRKIKDQEGAEGWVFHSLLSGKRMAIILGDNAVSAYEKPFSQEPKKPRISMHLEPMSVVEIASCEGAWCAITTSGLSGWIKRKSLWGVYETENID